MRTITGLLLLALTACDGGEGKGTTTDDTDVSEGISGMYEVRKEFSNLTACSDRGEQVEIPTPFVKLDEVDGGIDVTLCSAIDTCPPTADFDWRVEADGADWLGQTRDGYISEQESACVHVLVEATATFDGTEVTLDQQKYTLYDYEITAEGPCEESWTTWEGIGGSCAERRNIVADKVP